MSLKQSRKSLNQQLNKMMSLVQEYFFFFYWGFFYWSAGLFTLQKYGGTVKRQVVLSI